LLAIQPWTWRQYLAPKCQWTSTVLHIVTSQKSVLVVLWFSL
jgi:hypothetical protein